MVLKVHSSRPISEHDKREIIDLVNWKKRYKKAGKEKNFKEVLDKALNK